MSEMWKRTEFLLANGMSQLPNSSMTNDISPYECFDGGLDTDIDLDFSDASGRRKKPKRPRRKAPKNRSGISNLQKRRDERLKQKSEQSKSEQEAQTKAISDVTKSSEADALLLKQLQEPVATITDTPKVMSKKTKTALIVGSIAVASIIGFVLYKKFKK